MKKHFNFYNAARFVVFLQYLLCGAMALNLLLVYGLTNYATDHLILVLLFVVAITSRRLLKVAGPMLVQMK